MMIDLRRMRHSVSNRSFQIVDDDGIEQGFRGRQFQTELLKGGENIRFTVRSGFARCPLQIEVVFSRESSFINHGPIHQRALQQRGELPHGCVAGWDASDRWRRRDIDKE